MAHDFLHRRVSARRASHQPILLGSYPPPEYVPPAPLPEGRQVVPERARSPRRAGLSGYVLLYGFLPPAPVVLEVPAEGKSLFPDRAPGARRAGRSSYEVLTWAPPIEQLPVGEGFQPTAQGIGQRSRRRAAWEAYWLRDQFPRPDDRQLLPGHIALPQFAPRRAPNPLYWFRAVRQIEEPPPLPEGARAVPERAPSQRRASRFAYLAGGGVVDLIEATPPGPECPERLPRGDEGTERPDRLDLETNPPRPDRGDEATARPTRLDESSTRSERADEESSRPGRIDECR